MSPRTDKKIIESETKITEDNKMEKKILQEPKNPEPIIQNESQLME